MKIIRLGFVSALIFLAGCHGSARADLIKQSSAYNRTVLMVSSTDHTTGATGLTLTVKVAKAGGSYATITPTVTEQSGGTGRYSIALGISDTATLGAIDLQITAAGADPSDTHDQVVAFDPATVPPTASTIAAAVLGATVDGTLTLKQVQALSQSILTGKYSIAVRVSTVAPQITTYYRADGTTVLAVSTVTFNSSAVPTARTWTFTNLP